MIFLTLIKSGLGGALWPGVHRQRRARVSWTVHWLLIGGIVAGLAHLNQAWDLERALRSPWPIVHRVWLPALFLIAYAAIWLLHGLGKVLGGEPKSRAFADIDDAWNEGLAALREAGIRIGETPVYLLLGRPAGSEEALFQAADARLVVPGAPARKESPLRVFAHRQGIYVTCAGASLLGRQASHLLEAAIHQDLGDDNEPEAGPPARVGSRELIELYAARLHHLCRLIARARSPFCPINGILMLVPLAATNDSTEARQTARLAQLDLQVVRDGARVDCPLYIMVCDLEKSPGFGDLIAAMPPDQRQRALACRFPLVPDLGPAEVPNLVAGGVHWLLQAHLPMRVYPLLRLESPEMKVEVHGGPRNDGLVRFLAQMHFRANRLARLMVRAVYSQPGKLPMLGGIFLAGTGADPERGQGFAVEAFHDLAKTQNIVAWASEAMADETHFQHLARVVLAGAAVLSAGLVAGSFIIFR